MHGTYQKVLCKDPRSPSLGRNTYTNFGSTDRIHPFLEHNRACDRTRWGSSVVPAGFHSRPSRKISDNIMNYYSRVVRMTGFGIPGLSSLYTRNCATLTHLEGMVNVGEKMISRRIAVATGSIELPPRICDVIFDSSLTLNSKGDVRGIARIAGIQAAKNTSVLIPLCHQVPLNQVHIDIIRTGPNLLEIVATADASARTGVEMEALTAVSVSALTIYDMTKSALKGTCDKIIIKEIKLRSKKGGSNSFS